MLESYKRALVTIGCLFACWLCKNLLCKKSLCHYLLPDFVTEGIISIIIAIWVKVKSRLLIPYSSFVVV